MALHMKVMKGLGAFMLLNNITTLITRGPVDTPLSEEACLSKYKDFATVVSNNVTNYCTAVFDTYLCWPPTKPGTLIQQNCPTVRLSDPTRYASRRCREDGLWENRRQGEASVRGWTNFTTCFPPDIQGLFVEGFNEDQHYLTKYDIARKSRYIEITGYIISCVAIIVSLYIFYTFRTLQNVRTLIHKHVFYSMLSQTVICLIIFFDQFITRESIGVKTKHRLKGIDNTPNICEALYFIAEYSMSTVFSWVLVEGLHLNYLISNKALQPFNFKVYCLAAWLVPFFLTSIWAVVVWLSYRWDYVRVCWFGYNLASSYWILQGPRLTVILCNAVILIRVLKMVIQKLKDERTPEIIKIRKSVKATLFLLPILGLSNVLSTFDTSIHTPIYLFMALSYSRQFLKSFQGLLLSLIYCVGNEEVRTVVMRRIRSIFVFDNVNWLAIFQWLLPRQQVIAPNLPLSPLNSTTPPTVEETTLSQDMRSSSVTQQPPTPYEIPLAVISDSEGLNFKQNKQSFVSETSFTYIAFSRQIDSEVEDDENYKNNNINVRNKTK